MRMSGAEALIVENQVIMMAALAELAEAMSFGGIVDLGRTIEILKKGIETSDNEVRRAANEGVDELAKAGA